MAKIVYLVAEDWNVCSHFLPMLREARDQGLEVVVATRVRDHRPALESEGFRLVPLEAERRSLSPVEMVRGFWRMVSILRSERPELVHCISLRLVLFGGLAAKIAEVRKLVLAPIGLGHLWIENGIVERVARVIARFTVAYILRGKNTVFLFENREDPAELGLEADGPDVAIVGGAGLDPAAFPPAPEPPSPPIRVAVVARMTAPKGIVESIAAVRRARELGADVELSLYGEPDTSNRRALSEDELRHLADTPGVVWHGPSTDVAAVLRSHHIAMLLSYREGLPRSLIEATASARPVIATDVTGCRSVIRDGKEGLLVPLGDVEAAAAALVKLASDPGLRRRMGEAGTRRFRKYFTEAAVRNVVGAVYRGQVNALAAERPVKS